MARPVGRGVDLATPAVPAVAVDRRVVATDMGVEMGRVRRRPTAGVDATPRPSTRPALALPVAGPPLVGTPAEEVEGTATVAGHGAPAVARLVAPEVAPVGEVHGAKAAEVEDAAGHGAALGLVARAVGETGPDEAAGAVVPVGVRVAPAATVETLALDPVVAASPDVTLHVVAPDDAVASTKAARGDAVVVPVGHARATGRHLVPARVGHVALAGGRLLVALETTLDAVAPTGVDMTLGLAAEEVVAARVGRRAAPSGSPSRHVPVAGLATPSDAPTVRVVPRPTVVVGRPGDSRVGPEDAAYTARPEAADPTLREVVAEILPGEASGLDGSGLLA